MWNRKVFVRMIEVLFCIACVVALRVTDDESRRIFHYLRSRSREWSSLLNNVTWGAIGAALATATCGGYVIITAGLLVAAATSELKGRKTETFLLGLGVILFGIVGGLSLASIESVPQDLIDNAAVLGALCLATALLFIADLLIGQPSDEKKQVRTGQILPKDKDAAKRTIGATSLTSEKELKVAAGTNGGGGGCGDGDGSEKVREVKEDAPRFPSEPEESSRIVKQQAREPSEYTENLENGRTVLRATADPTTRDVYQRPLDELDTPPFPLHLERNLINPAVKIMRVDRDVQENIDNNRYSDTSQYDNVPSRLTTVDAASPGIRKKSRRDVSFNVPAADTRRHESGILASRGRDGIETLAECFGILRSSSSNSSSVATQTQTPSSPTDPGYVRHTASNWPRDLQRKTPPSAPLG